MKRAICAVILAAAMLATSTLAYAETTQQKLNAAKQEKAQTDSQLRSTSDRIATLESKKGEAEAYLTELNSQLTELGDELAKLQEQYAAKQNELDEVSEQLEVARLDEEQQREDMKLRIQYMYEHAESTGIVEALFSSKSFTEFLNRANNIQDMSNYDRQKLEEYIATCELITEKEEQVRTEQEEIEVLADQTEEKQAQMTELSEQTAAQVAEYAAQVKDQQSAQAQLLAKVQAQEESIRSLTRQVEEEVAAAEAAAAARRAQEEAERQAAAQQAAAQQAEAQRAESAEEPQAAEGAESEPEQAETKEEPKTEKTTETKAEKGRQESPQDNSSWSGKRLTRTAGTIMGPSGKETYYNMEMSGVIKIMRRMGNNDEYWVRSDGVKMLGDYVIVAANLSVRPRGSHIMSSLGMAVVCDTGGFAYRNPTQLDIAVNW